MKGAQDKKNQMRFFARSMRLATLVMSLGAMPLAAESDESTGTTGDPVYGATLTFSNTPLWAGNGSLQVGGTLTLASDALLRPSTTLSGVTLANSAINVTTPTTSVSGSTLTLTGASSSSGTLVFSGISAGTLSPANLVVSSVSNTLTTSSTMVSMYSANAGTTLLGSTSGTFRINGGTPTLTNASWPNSFLMNGGTLTVGIVSSPDLVLASASNTLTSSSTTLSGFYSANAGLTLLGSTSGSITINGGSTLTLRGASSSSGTLSSPNLVFASASNTLTTSSTTGPGSSSPDASLVLLGSTSGSITINGGTSSSGATLQVSNPGTIGFTGNTLVNSTTGLNRLVVGGATQLTFSQPVTVSSGTLSVQNATTLNSSLSLQTQATLSVNLGSGITVAGDVTLSGNLTVAAPENVPVGASYTILNKTSAGIIAGTFSGRPQGSVVSVSGNDFVISYTGGDGNDVTLTALSKVQAWRQAHFGTVADAGAAADTADADGDGVPNLIERACLLDPSASSPLPVTTARVADSLEYTYQRSVAAVNAGDLFLVEWNDSLASGTWSSLGVTQEVQSDDGALQVVKATVPAGSNGHRFIRLKITPAQ